MQPTTCYVIHAARGFTRSPWDTNGGSSSATVKRVFYPPKRSDRMWDTSSLLFNGYRDSFPAENGRGVKFTTYLHLVTRLNISTSTRSIRLHCVHRENYLDCFTVRPVGLYRSSGSNGSHEPVGHNHSHSHDRSLVGR
jgi:hypothetical protein